MKLRFVIDPKYDSSMIWQMLQGDDWKYRAKEMGISLKDGEKIHSSAQSEISHQLDCLVKKEYGKVLPLIQKAVNQYQLSWDEIIEDFSKTVEQLTYPWIYNEYICVVTNFHRGTSNWNGNIIGRWWKDDFHLERRITAHEIIIAHYFSIHRKYFPDSNLTSEQIWALAEIAALALTGLEERLGRFWPWDKSGYYTNHNYPQIVSLQKALFEPFIHRTSFKEYIEKGIRLAFAFRRT